MSKRVKEVRDTSSDDESSYRSGPDDSDSSDDNRQKNVLSQVQNRLLWETVLKLK